MSAFKFSGFQSPKYTQIPTEAFDYLMPRLSPAEWKVLCYIMRRAFGPKQGADAVSFQQMARGVSTRDEKVLDEGTGLSSAGVAEGVNGLLKKDIIVVDKRTSRDGDGAIAYLLHFAPDPGAPELGWGSPRSGQARGYPVGTQEAAPVSKDDPTPELDRKIETISGTLNDEPHLLSNQTRAARVFYTTGLSEQSFIRDYVDEAYRTAANQRTIRKPGDKPFTRNRMPYFFAVLTDLFEHR